MPHPADKKLDDLAQLLQASYNECAQNQMPYMAQAYDEYIQALSSLRLGHTALQETLLQMEEAADNDDEAVESHLLNTKKNGG